MTGKHVHGDGRGDIYENGIGGPDGLHHDHYFYHVNKQDEITGSGAVLRDEAREEFFRGVGSAAIRGAGS